MTSHDTVTPVVALFISVTPLPPLYFLPLLRSRSEVDFLFLSGKQGQFFPLGRCCESLTERSDNMNHVFNIGELLQWSQHFSSSTYWKQRLEWGGRSCCSVRVFDKVVFSLLMNNFHFWLEKRYLSASVHKSGKIKWDLRVKIKDISIRNP